MSTVVRGTSDTAAGSAMRQITRGPLWRFAPRLDVMAQQPDNPPAASRGRTRDIGLLIITALIVGVVALHSMSGPGAHTSVPAAGPGTAAEPHLQPDTDPVPPGLPAAADTAPHTPDSVVGPMTAMCVMILVGFLLLPHRRRGALSAARCTAQRTADGPDPGERRPHPPPSPLALGISRT